MTSTCQQKRCENPIPEGSRSHRRYCSPSCRAMESRNRQRAALSLFAEANAARAAGRSEEADRLDREAAGILASSFAPAAPRRRR